MAMAEAGAEDTMSSLIVLFEAYRVFFTSPVLSIIWSYAYPSSHNYPGSNCKISKILHSILLDKLSINCNFTFSIISLWQLDSDIVTTCTYKYIHYSSSRPIMIWTLYNRPSIFLIWLINTIFLYLFYLFLLFFAWLLCLNFDTLNWVID